MVRSHCGAREAYSIPKAPTLRATQYNLSNEYSMPNDSGETRPQAATSSTLSFDLSRG